MSLGWIIIISIVLSKFW